MHKPLSLRVALGAALTLALVAPDRLEAQYRPSEPVAELTEGALYGMLGAQQGVVSGCAARADTSAFVADVRATVRPGARPSTLYNARISVSVRARPRDGALEGCVRRAVVDSLRHRGYAVARSVRARRTFRVGARAEPPPPRPAVAYSEREVRRVLRAATPRLSRCLETAGVPERVTLHLVVERTGRMVLQNANLPPSASGRALGCLSRTVSGLHTRGRPGQRVQLTHAINVRSRAW